MSKITEEELQKIKDGREQVSAVAEYLSELVLQHTVLDNLVKNAKQLNEKYGEGLLNIETGDIETS